MKERITWRANERFSEGCSSDGACSPEWRGELCKRAAIISMKVATGGESRREALLMRQAGAVFRKLRISKRLSRQEVAEDLGVHKAFVRFLEGGLVSQDELCGLRDSIASILKTDVEVVDVLLDGRARKASEEPALEPSIGR